MPKDPGTLYVVATPIGNLDDITLRALKTLREVDLVAAEHVPVALTLLRHFEVETPVIPYHDQGPEPRLLVDRLRRGQSIAIVSDAGTPGLSDPAHAAVSAARDAGFRVAPIPGASAGATLWSAAGIPGSDFHHYGFLPRKPSAVRRTMVEVAEQGRPVIVFEAPRRLLSTLEQIERIMPDAQLVVGRELTKLHEQIWSGSPVDALDEFSEPRGEFTILIIPPAGEQQHWTDAEIADALADAASQGASRPQAARHVARQSGRPRRDVYALWPFDPQR